MGTPSVPVFVPFPSLLPLLGLILRVPDAELTGLQGAAERPCSHSFAPVGKGTVVRTALFGGFRKVGCGQLLVALKVGGTCFE